MSTEQLAQRLRDLIEVEGFMPRPATRANHARLLAAWQNAHAALVAYEAEKAQVVQDDDLVLVRRGVLGSACYAIRNGSPAPKTLEALRAAAMQGAAPAAPVAVPLTDEIIDAHYPREDYSTEERLGFRDGVRFAERFYGIKLEGGQG